MNIEDISVLAIGLVLEFAIRNSNLEVNPIFVAAEHNLHNIWI